MKFEGVYDFNDKTPRSGHPEKYKFLDIKDMILGTLYVCKKLDIAFVIKRNEINPAYYEVHSASKLPADEFIHEVGKRMVLSGLISDNDELALIEKNDKLISLKTSKRREKTQFYLYIRNVKDI